MQILKIYFRSPARTTIIGFAFFILIGTCILMLPQATRIGRLGFINALFTATSAVCVTGLTVVDTGTTFSLFGQFVLIVLIQTGGLGIMTISTLFLMIAGRRLSFSEQDVIQNTLTYTDKKDLPSVLKKVVFFTFAIEGLGVLLLLFCFYPNNEVPRALYLSVFHSISAFCNAGFSLFPDSFTFYQDNWVLNLTICFLVITGGIGFLVLSELKLRFSFKHRFWSRLSLHSKLVLLSTSCLLFVGTITIFLMEGNNTLIQLSMPHRILSSFFQAVNSRTSGFNTMPLGNMANETLFVLIILMFVGASPGSCGGGIKTTTFMTLILLGISRFKGQKRPQIFNRSISERSIGKAVSVLFISTIVVCIGITILLMTELGDVSHQQSRGKFLELFFEVVSAVGTVGFTTGITANLSTMGKMIITCLMFVGRLGPLIVVIAFSRSITLNYFYAEEDIMIG
ncbi:MAG: TrkH family potassium uptake protein [Candidatus Marinimicrobia bacterium]|nr:TrkH family potassium uptake protein [Candidatus Neomarinimicrobiota bacterium]